MLRESDSSARLQMGLQDSVTLEAWLRVKELKNGSYAAVISAAKDKISFMLFNADEIEEEKEQITPDASYSAVAEGIDSNNGGNNNNMMIGSFIALSVLGFILLRKKQKILQTQT